MRKLFWVLFLVTLSSILFSQIIDHSCTNITFIPQAAIGQAKADLHIAYGHTSHGSQLTDGTTGLISFANGGGLGLSLPTDIFAWNNGGSGGALDLHDYAMIGDCGYYPQWYNNTVDYLNNPANQDVNVIIWSWCGQISGYSEQNLIEMYINPMELLENTYPNVKFVYMTGHLNYGSHETTNLRNQQLRDFCIANEKILYDFADIESYDPDGTYFEFANDNCDYYSDWDYSNQGNWAIEWQAAHIENYDWYSCGAAHTQPLNANSKAYAAWWLWATLAGWDQGFLAPDNIQISVVSDSINISWDLVPTASSYKVYTSNDPNSSFTEDTSGVFTEESWVAPVGEMKKFYYVTAEK